jgi:hypothetical protein
MVVKGKLREALNKESKTKLYLLYLHYKDDGRLTINDLSTYSYLDIAVEELRTSWHQLSE